MMFVKSEYLMLFLSLLLFEYHVVAYNFQLDYTTSPNNDLTNYKPFECGSTIQVAENERMYWRFGIGAHINNASCVHNYDYRNITMFLRFSPDKTVVDADFSVTHRVEGTWTCSFWHYRDVNLDNRFYSDGHTYVSTYCQVTIAIDYILQVDYTTSRNNDSTTYVPFECGTDIQVTEYERVQWRFGMNAIINNATCVSLEYGGEGRMIFQRSQEGKVVNASLRATDRVAGAWNCTFLHHEHYVKTSRSVSSNGNYYIPTYCLVTIGVNLFLTYTVDNKAKSTYFESNKKLASYIYKEGNNMSFSCKRPCLDGGPLPDGASFKWERCFSNTDVCSYTKDIYTNLISTTHTFTKEQNASNISCIFTSERGTKYVKTILFLWEADMPPKISINNKTYEGIDSQQNVYEGMMGESLKLSCSNLEKTGSLFWVYCVPGADACNGQHNKNFEIFRDLTLLQKHNDTTLKCVYSNPIGSETSTIVRIRVIIPLRMSINNNYYDAIYSSLNVYEGMVGEFLNITCSNLVRTGTLHWSDIKGTDYGVSRKLKHNNIFRYFTLEQKHNDSTVKCVYTNPRGIETNTAVRIRVSTIFPGASTDDVSDILTVLPSTSFRNGDVLEFTCNCQDYQYMNITVGGLPIVTLEKPAYANKVSHKHKMQVNNATVVAACACNEKRKLKSSQNVVLTRITTADPSNDMDTSKLEENEANDTASAQSNFIIWLLIGCGILGSSILILIIIKMFVSRKRESKKKLDVTYENLQNETTLTPFPNGAKLEETYISPADGQESPYAVSHAYQRTTDVETYAQPYVEKDLDALYSKPLPKSLRTKTKDAPIYAVIPPKSHRQNGGNAQNGRLIYAELEQRYMDISKGRHLKRDSRIDTHEYASVMRDDARSIVLPHVGDHQKEPNYTNVFNNQSYVNCKDIKDNDDYAEPSYCELNRAN